ncbi:hypothetical protein GTA08_BOTSDO14212 [Botryosphaeria dothidea]|uniref:Zn(2)-C6 fungal-type domain-containing protein n=1 Tax=Botryosphaeria dothidea TaxID=55169 RepID=A0A8H4IPA3_9PEZI|nr:hypothetical protein GTA08_BOTSDO14212 [Botryosphaeria dothidea]
MNIVSRSPRRRRDGCSECKRKKVRCGLERPHRFDAARQPSRAAAAGPAAATHPAPVAAALVTDGPLPPPPLRHADRARPLPARAARLRAPPTTRAVLALTNRAVAGLHAAVARPDEVLRVETAMTAMALCTNDVCDGGDARQWRVHLAA